ncbi:hypothetical protein QBZ16_005360 [Prototheca wickerhamii]|uniref:Uncharacterized protein n=1 Tax=Prototheca wickerhamii TaxID=3111 RepID=A0AAD9IG49_PROWI|nr:hypothetical protein QBZ16_005360 [Prototheca wickerhamii]
MCPEPAPRLISSAGAGPRAADGSGDAPAGSVTRRQAATPGRSAASAQPRLITQSGVRCSLRWNCITRQPGHTSYSHHPVLTYRHLFPKAANSASDSADAAARSSSFLPSASTTAKRVGGLGTGRAPSMPGASATSGSWASRVMITRLCASSDVAAPPDRPGAPSPRAGHGGLDRPRRLGALQRVAGRRRDARAPHDRREAPARPPPALLRPRRRARPRNAGAGGSAGVHSPQAGRQLPSFVPVRPTM